MSNTAVGGVRKNVKTISVEQMTCIIQFFLSLLACILAWIIPEKIKWEQKYNSLCDVYRSMEYGATIQAIVDFFVFDCSKDVSKIHSECGNFPEQHHESLSLWFSASSLSFIRRIVSGGEVWI